MQNPGAPEPLYSISQVNALTGVPKSTIRFWEKEFESFLVPLRTTGNQRRYDPSSVEIIEKINRLVNLEGYTLEGARRQLEKTNGVGKASDQAPETNLNELAETMSDFLLRKLFQQASVEKRKSESILENN